MANCSPETVSWAEISAWVVKEIHLQWKWRLHGEGFYLDWKFSARAGRLKSLMYLQQNFSPGWNLSLGRHSDGIFKETNWRQWKNCAETRAETRHVIATKYQSPGGGGEGGEAGGEASWNSPCCHSLSEGNDDDDDDDDDDGDHDNGSMVNLSILYYFRMLKCSS